MLEIQDTAAVRTVAPYAEVPITVFMASTTGMRYISLSCIECGAPILERNNEMIYRLNDPDLPAEVSIGADSIKARCGRCQQWYALQISQFVQTNPDDVPLYLQPQSIYLQPAGQKRLRDIRCFFCGKSFHSISDRISQIIDNRVPFEQLNAIKLGPMEAICRWNQCSQHWAIMV